MKKSIHGQVSEDILNREQIGIERYNEALDEYTKIDYLKESYFEALDLVSYLRQAIWERDFSAAKHVSCEPFPVVQELSEAEIKVLNDAGTIQRKPFIMTTETTYIG